MYLHIQSYLCELDASQLGPHGRFCVHFCILHFFWQFFFLKIQRNPEEPIHYSNSTGIQIRPWFSSFRVTWTLEWSTKVGLLLGRAHKVLVGAGPSCTPSRRRLLPLPWQCTCTTEYSWINSTESQLVPIALVTWRIQPNLSMNSESLYSKSARAFEPGSNIACTYIGSVRQKLKTYQSKPFKRGNY